MLPCKMCQNHIWSHNYSTENIESLIKDTLCFQEAEDKTLAPEMMHTERGHQAEKGIMWCNTELELNAGDWNKLLWRTHIHLSTDEIW